MSDTTEKTMFKIFTQPSNNAELNVRIQKGSVLELPKKISFGIGNKRLKYATWLQESLAGNDEVQERLQALARIFELGQEKGAVAIHYYDKNLSWVADEIAKFLTDNKKTLEAIIPYLKQGMTMQEKSIDEMNEEERDLMGKSTGKKTLADLPAGDRDQISALLKQELGESAFEQQEPPAPPQPLPMSDQTKIAVSNAAGVFKDEAGNFGHVFNSNFVITPYLKTNGGTDLLALAKIMTAGLAAPQLIRSATVNSILVKAGSDEFFLARTTERVEGGITDFDFVSKVSTQVEFDNKLYLYGNEFTSTATQAIVALRADCYAKTSVAVYFCQDEQYTISTKVLTIRLVAENGETITTPSDLADFVTSVEVLAVALELSLECEEVDQGQAIANMLNASAPSVVAVDDVVEMAVVETVLPPTEDADPAEVAALATEIIAADGESSENIVGTSWEHYKTEHPEVLTGKDIPADINSIAMMGNVSCVNVVDEAVSEPWERYKKEHPEVTARTTSAYTQAVTKAALVAATEVSVSLGEALGKSPVPEDIVETKWEQYKKEHPDVFATVVATPEQPQ